MICARSRTGLPLKIKEDYLAKVSTHRRTINAYENFVGKSEGKIQL